jgi:hypothetical protein
MWFWRNRKFKVYRQTDGRTDTQTVRRQTTGNQKNSLELSAQVSLKLNRLKKEIKPTAQTHMHITN